MHCRFCESALSIVPCFELHCNRGRLTSSHASESAPSNPAPRLQRAVGRRCAHAVQHDRIGRLHGSRLPAAPPPPPPPLTPAHCRTPPAGMATHQAADGTITSRVYSRIGLLGNPSDGFQGACLSLSLANFWAEASCVRYGWRLKLTFRCELLGPDGTTSTYRPTAHTQRHPSLLPSSHPAQVTLTPSATLTFVPNPECDPWEFQGPDAFVQHIRGCGFYGGVRLLQARALGWGGGLLLSGQVLSKPATAELQGECCCRPGAEQACRRCTNLPPCRAPALFPHCPRP